ncbi:MAG: hypothetical protein ABT05_00305 [Lautropia sp. SCN 66-9]|nr:MAG: hypothetical protein ABT05_00305 [Lautropia sp. SCN 66-9]
MRNTRLSKSLIALAALMPAAAWHCHAAAQAAAAAQASATALRVQRIEIIDRQGFDKPLVAATIMVPAGWQHRGDVQWKVGQRCNRPYAIRLQASAPDASAAIELSPFEAWGTTNYGAPVGDCPQASFRDAREYLSSWVQRQRPNARLIEYRPRPDKSRLIAQNQSPQSSMRQWIDSGQALITYRAGGRDVHELLSTNVSFSHMRMSGGAGSRAFESIQGQALGVLSWRSNTGPVPQKHFDLVWETLKAGPEWQARINAAEQQMAADSAATQAQIARIQRETSRETMAHIARRGEIMNQTREETARIRNETWRSTQATQDRIHTNNVRALREVHGYRAPRGGVVELPHHYQHAWQLRDGSYVLTDNPNFNPARDIGIAGQQLQRTRE